MESRLLDLRNTDSTLVLKALASETRVHILTLLADEPRNINTLGQILGISQPSITKHVQVLAQAGLVTTEYRQGSQGLQKVCGLRYNRFIFTFEGPMLTENRVEEIAMPIGLYTHVQAAPTCGLASRDRIIDFLDEPQAFFHPDRSSAQILWTSEGFVEYVFPNTLPASLVVNRLELVMEICSEAPDYDCEHPSDITVWINGVEVGTWTSPGDFGGKRGWLNPPWWNEHSTQFGMLKIWSVDADGASVDGTSVSGATLRDIGLASKQPIVVRIGVKPDAEHAGGFNLFGRGFGNYEQDLILRLHYATRPQFAGRKSNPEATVEPETRLVVNSAPAEVVEIPPARPAGDPRPLTLSPENDPAIDPAGKPVAS